MLIRYRQHVLLFALILGAYYSVLHASFNSLDDVHIVSTFENTSLALRDILFPPKGWSQYYRPLITASFLWDQRVWGFAPSVMHLESVLAHILNAFLVWRLTRLLVPEPERNISWKPFVAALIFGLHPVNTEAVAWIAGRTDVIATTFLLGSIIAFLKYREGGRLLCLPLTCILLLLALLCKETAAAGVGMLCLLIAARSGENDRFPEGRRWGQIKTALLLCCVVAVAIAAIRVVQVVQHPFGYLSSRVPVQRTLLYVVTDPAHSFFVCLRALGFYAAKLFCPWPLNFAIVEVDPLYELLGMAVVAGLTAVLFLRTRTAAILVGGALLITPAFLIAFDQIAWTAYAERYLYMVTAFVVPVMVLISDRCFGSRLLQKIAVISVVMIFSVSTMLRARVWRSNLSLYEDTVRKTPDAPTVLNEYAAALINAGRMKEAMQQLRKAQTLPTVDYDVNIHANIANILGAEGKTGEALAQFREIIAKAPSNPRGYHFFLGYLNSLLLQEKRPGGARSLMEEQVSLYRKLFELEKNPFSLYRMASLQEKLGRDAEATANLRRLLQEAPSSEYAAYARKVLGAVEK